MIASLKGYGRIARTVLTVIGGLLVLGIVGSFLMSFRATDQARAAVVAQATQITDSSLALAFSPDDLSSPVSPDRAVELAGQVQSIIIDPSDFTDVTVFSPEGTILYSTSQSLIGTQLPGERERIREALRGVPQTKESEGAISILVPLTLRSGVGDPAAVELTRPDDPIAAAPGPWRTNAMFLFAMLILLSVAVFGVARVLAVVTEGAEVKPQLAPQPAPQPMRQLTPPLAGMREEGEARRRAEDRARAAEERLSLLQEQYRKALEDLQAFQRQPRDPQVASDPRVEERALRAEGQVATMQQQVQTLAAERQQLAAELEEQLRRAPDDDTELLLRAAERESQSLRADMANAHAELARTEAELETRKASAGYAPELQAELDRSQVELMRAKDSLASAQGELDRSRRELEDGRVELRALRNEEQRAAMLDDELRAAKAEIESFRASHRADLVEREAEFEDKVRSTREEFQRQIAAMQASYESQVGQKEAELANRIATAELSAQQATIELEEVRSEMEAARAEAASREQRLLQAIDQIAAMRAQAASLDAEIKERTLAVAQARKETDDLRRSLVSMQADLALTDGSVGTMEGELDQARTRASEAEETLASTEHERTGLRERAEKLAAMLESAAAENADLNRRLQEIESRRQLELADDEGRSQIDDLLRVTQERLAGQTEKLIAAEERARELEAVSTDARDRADIAEGELRTHQMSEALREMREPETADAAATATASASASAETVVEDRRATTPFLKELSLDAKKSLSRINGIAQLLKHKRDAKDQSQLLKQLAANMRRLDYAVSDMTDSERLVRGTVDLQIRNTDLDALVRRVVEESEIGADHEVRVLSDPVSIRVDAQRAEQIVASLLRNAGDRTPNGKQVTVRLQPQEGGALLAVEDPEPSSDASMSPVVRRLAEIHGGWAKVESHEGGGSSFRVFLPDAEAPVRQTNGEQPLAPELRIVVDDVAAPPEEPWEPSGEQILSQELRRLATEGPKEPERSSRRSRAKR